MISVSMSKKGGQEGREMKGEKKEKKEKRRGKGEKRKEKRKENCKMTSMITLVETRKEGPSFQSMDSPCSTSRKRLILRYNPYLKLKPSCLQTVWGPS